MYDPEKVITVNKTEDRTQADQKAGDKVACTRSSKR